MASSLSPKLTPYIVYILVKVNFSSWSLKKPLKKCARHGLRVLIIPV